MTNTAPSWWSSPSSVMRTTTSRSSAVTRRPLRAKPDGRNLLRVPEPTFTLIVTEELRRALLAA